MHEILQQILYFFGHGFCHQYPERSFEADGLYFSVCSRDTGIYLGLIFTLIVLLVMCARMKNKPAAMPPVWAVVVSILLILPMAVDGARSYLGLRETNNVLRYTSGYLCGAGLAVLASGGVFSLWAHANHQESAVDKPSRLSTLLVASAAAGAAFYVLYPSLGVIAPFLAFSCQWLAFTLVNLLILSSTRLWPRGNTNPPDMGAKKIETAVETATEAEAEAAAESATESATEAEAEAATEAEAAAAAAAATGAATEIAVEAAPVGRSRPRLWMLVVLCILAAVIEMAVLSLVASGLGLLFPWYIHP